MEAEQVDSQVLSSIMGRTLKGWHLGEGGIHFDLDDGRMVIFSGVFVIAVYQAEENVLH